MAQQKRKYGPTRAVRVVLQEVQGRMTYRELFDAVKPFGVGLAELNRVILRGTRDGWLRGDITTSFELLYQPRRVRA